MQLERFINIQWYISRKPYSRHTEYDIFYLKICRDIFQIIDKVALEYVQEMSISREDSKEMAYVLTSYFEDIINDIGFWQSLIDLHQKQFGKRVPFFSKQELHAQEVSYTDILPADIHYLAYITYFILMKGEDEIPVIPFNHPFFKEITGEIFDYLDNIDDIPMTEFYESFLTPPDDYIQFKKVLIWFTFRSYLTGKEFTKKLQRIISGETKTKNKMVEPYVIYSEEDRLMSDEPSSFTGLFPVDILAGALRCDSKNKSDTAHLKWHPLGIFHVTSEKATHYHFTHTATDEEFNVTKRSLGQPLDIKGSQYWLGKLAYWNHDYWLSGSCMGYPAPKAEIERVNIEEQRIFQKHFMPYRKKVAETALDYRNKAAEFFSGDLIIFNSGFELQEKMNEFHRWHFETVTDKTNISKNAAPLKVNFSKDLLSESDIALFIPQADNICFITSHRKFLSVLDDKESDRSPQEIREALNWLLDDSVNAEYCLYLWKKGLLKKLPSLFGAEAATYEDFEAWQRIYKPFDFSPLRLPRFTIVNSETTSKGVMAKTLGGKE